MTIKFTFCLMASIVALFFSFVSAISYDRIFIIVALFGCAGSLPSIFMIASERKYAYLVPFLFASYSVVDVALRYTIHIRLLDFLFGY
jgi:hypothetical protein